jgi:hypothetical protein
MKALLAEDTGSEDKGRVDRLIDRPGWFVDVLQVPTFLIVSESPGIGK